MTTVRLTRKDGTDEMREIAVPAILDHTEAGLAAMKKLEEAGESRDDWCVVSVNEGRRVGALVVFDEGVTKEQAEIALRNVMIESPDLDVAEISSMDVRTFKPSLGYPVFYIP